MPEVGLGIGCEQGSHEGYTREWLYWYNQQNRLPAPANVIEQERQRAERLNSSLSKSGSGSCRAAAAERAQQQLEQERQQGRTAEEVTGRGINLDDL